MSVLAITEAMGLTGKAANTLGHLANQNGWNKVVVDQAEMITHLQQQWSQPLTILGTQHGVFFGH